MSYLKRSKSPSKVEFSVPREELEKWPAVLEYMTATQSPDGSRRKTSTLFLFAEDGLFKGALNDRDSNETLWAADMSPIGVLDALEVAITSGSGIWKQAQPRKSR